MYYLENSRFFNSKKLDSKIKSKDTQNSEKWLGYFVGPMGAAFLNTTLISYLNMFYTDVLDMTHAFSWAVVFLTLFPILSKVVDAITNVIMGQIVDHTRSRQGKARPWILISAPLMSVAYLLVFLVPREHSILQFVLVALTYNIFFGFAFTIYNMSHLLMVPLSTTNTKQRDGLALFSNMGVSMIPGTVVSLLFPVVLLPMIGADYDMWLKTMAVMAAVALPLTLIEYYHTKERVTEAAAETSASDALPLKEQIKICFRDKYWILLVLFVLIYMVMSNVNSISVPYFCNWVLGTYNDGFTQMILSAVGKFPLGVGVVFLWPLVKKFGKRPVMIIGFSLAAVAEVVCWFGSHSMPVMLVGSFIYAIGFLPSYVYTAIMADTLDYIEYKENVRVDGLTASVFTIVGTVSVGLGQGLFNFGLSIFGYEAPYFVSEGVYNVQNSSVQTFISFAYIGVPLISLALLALIMFLLDIENRLPQIHEELEARHAKEKGEEE